jgi:c(7)-type cytochrome triheme protein
MRFARVLTGAALAAALMMPARAEDAPAEEKKAENPAAASAEKAPVVEKTAPKDAKAQALITDPEKAPEFLKFEKTSKMAPVKFPHKQHGQKFACKECHGGDKPLFPQKFSDEEGMKMADMYAGKNCGACHDGKDHGDNKKVFAAKTSCMKCHKK